MLLRMYTRWAESKGHKVEWLEESIGEEAGLKSSTIKIMGHYAYGWLKTESGVHRLVRISPFDSSARRHTSFSSIWVYPVIDDAIEIEIEDKDLRIDTYRASGAGGQHVNTTDSAVQVTHLPTGIQVKCQDGRSQGKNKEKALQILRAKLLEAKIREEHEKYSAHRKNLIGSGGREEKIRTYNFPQNRLTDHRVNMTLYNLDQVITGDLEETIGTLQASEMADRLAELEAG